MLCDDDDDDDGDDDDGDDKERGEYGRGRGGGGRKGERRGKGWKGRQGRGVSCFFALGRQEGWLYREQNVRQRQKLISIIDYDVCMTFY